MTGRKDGNGEISGHIVVRLSDPMVSFSGDVTCLQVQDNQAWIGVHISKSDATSARCNERRTGLSLACVMQGNVPVR